MKRLRHIALIILVVVLQLFAVLLLTLKGVDANKTPYRRAERFAALIAAEEDPSPEKKAVLQQELRLASRYVGRQQFTRAGVVFAVLLSIEAILIYWTKRNSDKNKAAVQSII